MPLHLLAGWALAELLTDDWGQIIRQKGLWLLALVPAFGLALGRLATKPPTRGTSLDELGRSMAWFTALIAALLLAALIRRVASRLSGKQVWRLVGCAVVMVLLALTVRFAWMATFINADMANEFLVYAQAAPDVAIVNREIRDLSYRLTGGLHLKVAYDDESSWPWVWYLREFHQRAVLWQNARRAVRRRGGDCRHRQRGGHQAVPGQQYIRREYRLIWWPTRTVQDRCKSKICGRALAIPRRGRISGT